MRRIGMVMTNVPLKVGEFKPDSPNVHLDIPQNYLATVGTEHKRQTRILVVDDIDTNREIVEAYLIRGGYGVDSVGSAAEAIEILENGSCDLVLMDIQMPVMDGVAATQRIRSLPKAIKDIPIIAMTGNVFPDQVRSYLKAGMNGHVGKPIEPAGLYKSIQRCLSEAGHNQIAVAPSPLNALL
jgi:CheY-like chemotaxis protein